MERPKVVPIASRSESSFSWTTPQMLRDLADEIECGKVQVETAILCFVERLEDGKRRPRRYFVNARAEEAARLALMFLRMTMDDLFGP